MSVVFIAAFSSVKAQDNSPYSRYGWGTITPPTNILNRGMGGISAAYNDPLTVNFINPASYSAFKTYLEQKSKKSTSGRVILDAGINYSSRTLREGSDPAKFTSSDIYFSYLQVGIPLRKNWGLSFGLRPYSRIYYKISQRELLIDPITHQPIDSAQTEYSGDGGAYLPSIGTGYAIKNFSFGINVGYVFGTKNYSTKRYLFNDSTFYKNANFETKTYFGSLFYTAGVQYKANLTERTSLSLGVFGNLEKKINARQNTIRETFLHDVTNGNSTLDSVNVLKDVKGTITSPLHYGAGFVLETQATTKKAGWLVGVDFIQTKWSDYRFYNETDQVKDNWELRAGVQFRPPSSRNYFSSITYRAGFFTGPDYINVNDEKLNQTGVTFGLGLPVANYSHLTNQFTIINLAFEYIKRGNNDNALKENLFRISIGLNLSDIWFGKKKYD
ncbi:MAG: hypothetical protein ABUT20_05325 [Bacteroidota bacterium]